MGAVASRAFGIIGGVFTSDWTPERNRNERPLPQFNPQLQPLPQTKPNDNTEKYITVYRGIGESEDMNSKQKQAYEYAKNKVAMPLGLIPDNSKKDIVTNPDVHVAADNNSIFTSWTLSRKKAEGSAKGKEGKNRNPIIRVKRVKISETIQSRYSTEYVSQNLEVLLKGVQQPDSKYEPKHMEKK